jgi:tyrosyl-tRNA synthetase
VARDLQRDYGQPAQIIATVPLLEGLDGIEKMSKSKGNYVGICEEPGVMMKKLMTISDSLMWRYFELLTDVQVDEIAALRKAAQSGERNPRDIKLDLGERIIADFHSAEDARAARTQWLAEISQHQIPVDLETVQVADARINKILVQAGLAGSGNDADRLVKSGAVAVASDGSTPLETLTAPSHRLDPGTYVVRAGKRWKRVVV